MAEPVDVTELSDADALTKATEVYAWMERAMLAGESQVTVLKYLSLELQAIFIKGAKTGAADLYRELQKRPPFGGGKGKPREHR